MDSKHIRQYMLVGWAAAFAAVLQIIGLIRYLNRLPDDWVGIGLYVVTILALTGISAGAFITGKKEKS